MFSRTSALWILVGLLAGYALAGRSAVEAQESAYLRPWFVNVGDSVTLQFERGALAESGGSVQCAVTQVWGMWVRCGPEERFGLQREEKWYSFQRVAAITKRER